MNNHAQLEATLCQRLNRKHALFTGRAATGIYLACRALSETVQQHRQLNVKDRTRGKLVVPAICCPSPATVALYAELDPVFCDIDPGTFNLCPLALESMLVEHPEVVAVLAVHLYGQPAAIHRLQAITQRFGVALIEDAAQALGGDIDHQPIGSFGDVSVVSFGHTKQVDVGWGGAVLTDSDVVMLKMREHLAKLPIRPQDINQQFSEYRRIIYLLLQRRKKDPDIDELFVLLPSNYRQMHLFRAAFDGTDTILRALQNVQSDIEQRRNLSLHYRERLQHPSIRHSQLQSGASPWRHTLRVPAAAQSIVTDALRQADIDASNWYPSLHRWYRFGRQQVPSELAESERHEKEVVNLWVTPGISMDRIDKTCEIILNSLAHLTPKVA